MIKCESSLQHWLNKDRNRNFCNYFSKSKKCPSTISWYPFNMNAAEITGKKASSRSLRHSMGVVLALDKVPLNVIQDILGHKLPESTQIYMQVLGEDWGGY
jgi:integrase